MSFDLGQILNWIDIDSGNLNIQIDGLSLDSRKVKPGDLFIALNGVDYHGMDFAYQVERTGAKAILAETLKDKMAKPKSRRQPLRIPVIEIENLNQKLGAIASMFHGEPSKRLKVFGITGTNGKTSSAWLLAQSWEKLGIKAGYIGTLGFGTINRLKPLKNTTPSSLKIQRTLKEFEDQGITHVAMEVSSHALDQGRCNSIQFSGTGFTNLTQDHLDYHHTFENYASTKLKLFTEFNCPIQVINFDDATGKNWIETVSQANTYAINNKEADIYVKNFTLSPQGLSFEMSTGNQQTVINSQLLGKFNIENLLLVISFLTEQEHSINEISAVIPKLFPVMGRMNTLPHDNNQPNIVIDYAHTPDALKQVLMALKQHNPDNLWCVFGCGGNRDKGKRPQMGHLAEQLADHVIVTDDNPRFESSEEIINDILMGMNTKAKVIRDREEAIKFAIKNAQSNDLILIAGKGHENYQEIEGTLYPFDDKNIANQYLEKRA